MKSLKICLCIAGFALTGLCYGQLHSNYNNDMLYYTAYYSSVNSRFEHRLNEYPERTASENHLETSILSRTYFVPLENDLAVESWMTVPFEANYYEEEMDIESWMTAPFESCYFEPDPEVEPWMTKSWQ